MFKYTLLLIAFFAGSAAIAEESFLKTATNIKQACKWMIPTFLAGQHFTAKDIVNMSWSNCAINFHDFAAKDSAAKDISRTFTFCNLKNFTSKDMLPKRHGTLLIPCAAAWLYDSFNTIRQYKIVRKDQ